MTSIRTTMLSSLLLLACGKSDDDMREAAHTGTGRFDGTVRSSTHPSVKAGSACNGTMMMRGADKPARMTLSCAGVTLYQGEGVFTNNLNDPNNPDDDTMSFRDAKTSDADGSPAALMAGQEGKADGDSGVLSLHDVARGADAAFEIVIAL